MKVEAGIIAWDTRVMSVKRVEAPEEFDSELDELEKKIDRLRILYEQFFLGIEKLPPYPLQQDVVRIFHLFSTYHIRKTNHKFRYQALVQRFNVHRAYWQRTVRAIEEGTYQRHRLRVERRELARTGELIDNEELAKRVMLAENKGDWAVELRRQRMLEVVNQELVNAGASTDEYRPALLRGIERRIKRRRRRRGENEEIQGVPLEELIRRAQEHEGETRSAQAPATLSEEGSGPPGPANGQIRQVTSTGAQAMPGPVPSVTFLFPRLDVLRTGTSVHSTLGPPASVATRLVAPLSPPPPAAHILDHAGISTDRAQQIFRQFVEARRQAGQSVEHVTFDKLADSMARQVVKARQTLGVEQVDFAVVSKGDKIFLKPIPK